MSEIKIGNTELVALVAYAKENEQDFILFLEDFPLPKDITIDDILGSLMPILGILKGVFKKKSALIEHEKEERLEEDLLRKKAIQLLEEMEAKKKKDDENNNDLEY